MGLVFLSGAPPPFFHSARPSSSELSTVGNEEDARADTGRVRTFRRRSTNTPGVGSATSPLDPFSSAPAPPGDPYAQGTVLSVSMSRYMRAFRCSNPIQIDDNGVRRTVWHQCHQTWVVASPCLPLDNATDGVRGALPPFSWQSGLQRSRMNNNPGGATRPFIRANAPLSPSEKADRSTAWGQ